MKFEAQYNITANAWLRDAPVTLVAASPSYDACSALEGAEGHIVLVADGNCTLDQKLANAASSGASGAIIAHGTGSPGTCVSTDLILCFLLLHAFSFFT
jgi:hypothetical protein